MRTPSLSLRRLPLALALLSAGFGAAVGCLARTSDVQLLRTQLPARPEGCPVNVLADARSPYPVEDLAIVTITYTPGGKDVAMHRLQEQTCYYGGDTLYRIVETQRSNATTEVSATVSRRGPGADPAAAPAPAAPPSATLGQMPR